MKKLFIITLLTFSLNANSFNIIAESNSWTQTKRDYCYKEGVRLSNMTQNEFNDNPEKAINEFNGIAAHCNAVPDSLIMENYRKLTDSYDMAPATQADKELIRGEVGYAETVVNSLTDKEQKAFLVTTRCHYAAEKLGHENESTKFLAKLLGMPIPIWSGSWSTGPMLYNKGFIDALHTSAPENTPLFYKKHCLPLLK